MQKKWFASAEVLGIIDIH